jgi:hypothetical protein
MEQATRKKREKQHPAAEAMRASVRRSRYPDLTGMTIGTWRILYEAKGEEKPFCMCQCLRCGVKKIILVCKFLKGYVLKCPECKIRQGLIAKKLDCKPEVDWWWVR